MQKLTMIPQVSGKYMETVEISKNRFFFLRNEQKNSRVPPKKNFNRLIILKVNLN